MLVDQSKTTGQMFSREQFPLGGGGHLERVDGLVLEPHPEQHRRLYGGEGHRVGLCQTANSLCQTAQGSCQTPPLPTVAPIHVPTVHSLC